MDVVILGVGPTGRTFAQACTGDDFTVTLCGADANAVLDAVDSLSAGEADGTTDVEAAVEGATVVVETRSADVDTVRERLASVEDAAPDDAQLLVTVESTSVTSLAVALREPERLVGLHAASPGEWADLLEVVVPEGASELHVDAAESFVERLGWQAVRVHDAPGFVSDRLRLALQAEAIRLYEQGVADAGEIDRTMTVADGHDIGPLELADRQGLDTVLSGLQRLTDDIGPRYEPPELLAELVEAGKLGRARGEGFYDWDENR